MDIIGEYFYVIILIIGAIAQWMKSRSEAKAAAEEERRRPTEDEEEFFGPDFDLEDMLERSSPQPAVPPPLPGGSMPGVEKSAVPDLRRRGMAPPPVQAAEFQTSTLEAELQRQASLAEQVALMKQAKKTRNPDNAAAMKARSNYPNFRPISGSTGTGLKQRLSNREELKKAFVLKEILEKPIGLR